VAQCDDTTEDEWRAELTTMSSKQSALRYTAITYTSSFGRLPPEPVALVDQVLNTPSNAQAECLPETDLISVSALAFNDALDGLHRQRAVRPESDERL
jgi:hypothetical protein